MVENLSTKAVLKDALSSAATDIFNKLDQTVQNIGKNKPTEDAPLSYKVTHKGGALVRSGYETTSSQVHQLDAGEVVTIVELVGRRARIISPVEGWVSTETKDGVQIMKPCTLQRKSQQNQAFEHMFEQKFNRLKHQTGSTSRGSGYDPRAERFNQDRDRDREPSYSPRSDSDEDRGRGSRDAGRSRQDRQPAKASGGENIGAFVPKLSAPGSKGGPTFMAPPPGQRPAGAAPAAAASSSGFDDLLSMGDSQPPAASAPAPPASNSSALLDPFGDAPFAAAPAAPAAPAAAVPSTDFFGDATFSAAPAPAAAAGGASDWAGFQGAAGGAGMGNAFNPMAGQQQAAFNPMAGQQPATGYGVLGAAPPAQATGMQAMGWGGGQPGMQAMGGAGMQNPMGMGAAMGQGGGMGVGAMGGMFGGAAPQAQQPGAWNAFGAGAPAAAARPPQQGVQQPGSMPAFGGYGMGGPAPGSNNVDDLMSKAMQGVSNLSLDQRSAPQAPGGGGMPMNMMFGNR